jgi:uncharacterized membrane protein
MNKRNIVIVGILVGVLAFVGIFAVALTKTSAHNVPSRSQNYALQHKGQFGVAKTQGFGAKGEGRYFGFGRNNTGYYGGEMVEVLSKYLGISEDTLRDEIKSGKTLVEIAKEHGKSADDLVNFFESEAKEHLQQALKAGRITNEQYENALKNIKQWIEQRIDEKAPFGRFGEGMREMRKRGCQNGMHSFERIGRRGMGHWGNAESPVAP